jgi:hypothetical protein
MWHARTASVACPRSSPVSGSCDRERSTAVTVETPWFATRHLVYMGWTLEFIPSVWSRRREDRPNANLWTSQAAGFVHQRPIALTLAAGTRLGSYEILGALGAGGMGEVHRARDRRADDAAVGRPTEPLLNFNCRRDTHIPQDSDARLTNHRTCNPAAVSRVTLEDKCRTRCGSSVSRWP